MKKHFLLFISLVLLASVVFGGGIVTNSNQSAYWVRTLVRDAAIGPDAVHFNPAGLTKLSDGFHFSLSSQTIFQNKAVTNDYAFLSPRPKKFIGDVVAPVFPSFFATWKKNKIAISFGFTTIGGGGGATFEDGLPAFEQGISDMAHFLSHYGATDYRREVYFKGTSRYLGYQLGLTYQINDVISVYGGLRYVTVKNTYEGYLKNVEVNMGGNWTEVSDVFSGMAAQAGAGATGASSISGTMGALIGGGVPGTFTLAQAEGAGAISPEQRAQIEGGLTALGIPASLQIGQIQTACDGAYVQYTAAAAEASQTAALTGMLFNQTADIEQKGNGFAPIIGVNLAINEKLNIGLKYEFKTRIQVKNKRLSQNDFIIDMTDAGAPIYFLQDGTKVDNDMPAVFSAGIDYKVTPKLTAAGGFHYYWDKDVSYGKQINYEYVKNSEVIDDNNYELAFGLEYSLTDKWFLSGGFLLAHTGVSQDYQSDLSYSLSSNTFGGGLGYKLNDKMMINIGVSYTGYKEDTKYYPHIYRPTETQISSTDTYSKNALILAIGLDLSL